MSLYGMMRTGVSGMSAQANRLSTVADNIANSSTTGYKRSSTEFSSMVVPGTAGSYNSGGVTTSVRTSISVSGVLQYTTSITDLAVKGDGFFVVQDSGGQPFLTRAGSFVPDGSGRLVNAAGFQLMGYSYANGEPVVTANGFDGLEPVVIPQNELVATPSTSGVLTTNLPKDAEAVAAANLPSANGDGGAPVTYTAKTSLVAYDNAGTRMLVDVYYTKTGDNTWEVTMYNRADAAPNTSFPYTSDPLATETLTFDPTTNKLDAGSATSIDIPIPDGQTVTLDLSATSQLAADFSVSNAEVDGNPPNSIESLEISTDGIIYAQYGDGSFRPLYRIPLADVPSPDRLQVLSGNVFSQSNDSGGVRLGFPGEGSSGEVISGALESSNVDIAEELTSMIEAQRSYTANSKVFQTGSDLMDLLVNLKR